MGCKEGERRLRSGHSGIGDHLFLVLDSDSTEDHLFFFIPFCMKYVLLSVWDIA